MSLTATKIVVAILFGIVRFFFGMLPIKIYVLVQKWEHKEDKSAFEGSKRHEQVKCGLAMMQSFGGGVLFATCLLHMMPEVHESVEDLKKYSETVTDYPFSQLIVCLGFLAIYFVEEISNWLISKVPQEQVNCDGKHTSPKRITSNKNKVSPSPRELSEKSNPFTIEAAMEEQGKTEDSFKFDDDMLEKVDDGTSDYLQVAKENEKNLELSKELDVNSDILVDDKEEDKEVRTKQHLFRGVVVILALSLHAILEGLAIGLQNSAANIWYLFVAVSIHSATILFCIGLELLLAKTRLCMIILHILILSLTSPLGIIIGLLITVNYDMNTRAKSTAVVFLEGLSAGTVLYITFFEVLNREKERRVYRLRRALCILGGFILMAILQCIDVYSQ